jgi:ring-1,2-phenylacetyl-CoA epoxidase subunit PaaC
MDTNLYNYLLQLGDNALIFGHRLSEWCGHGPALELDMALSNIALDNIGAARLFYQYAAELEGNDATEDSIAFLRQGRNYRNIILVEQPNGDFAHTLAKTFYFCTGQQILYKELLNCTDERIASIAEKSLKEVNYHVHFTDDWLMRLGDGTKESAGKIQTAIDALWAYSGELFIPGDVEKQSNITALDWEALKEKYTNKVSIALDGAKINMPTGTWFHTGGKNGLHSEHLGFLLAEMQYLQRSYPGAKW